MKRAIISVSNKHNIVNLLNFLLKNDFTIYSTGGTYNTIIQNCINSKNVLKISDLTQFPEILNGRVKTLHPHIYAGLLADKTNDEHTHTMEELQLPYFDVVVCNLYPFEESNTIENINKTLDTKKFKKDENKDKKPKKKEVKKIKKEIKKKKLKKTLRTLWVRRKKTKSIL